MGGGLAVHCVCGSGDLGSIGMGDSMIKINLGFFVGVVIAMWTAHTMWGSTGMWFTFGLSLQAAGLNLTIGRRV